MSGTTTTSVAVIGAPLDLGQSRRGVDMGPSAIRYAGLEERLQQLGLSVDDHGCPVLSLHDRRGRPRALLSLDELTGMATISCVDGHGNPRAMMSEELDGAPVRRGPESHRTPGVPALPLGDVEPTRTVPDPRLAELTARMAQLERGRRRHWVSAAALVVIGALVGSAASGRPTPGGWGGHCPISGPHPRWSTS